MNLSILEHNDSTGNLMAYRVISEKSGAIEYGSQCIVRESQTAIFMRDGKALVTLPPGRHVLTTQNLSFLNDWTINQFYDGKSPFRAEVYFLNMKLFPNLKWGTMSPITFRDKELSMIRLRMRGIYSVRIIEPQLFLNQLVGTASSYEVGKLEDYLRQIIVARLTDVIGELLETFFDLPKYYDEISAGLKGRMGTEIGAVGLQLVDLTISAITPPDEVQKRIDQRGGMAALGNLDDYSKLQAADAMKIAAGNPGGGAGSVAGLGAGIAVGAALGQQMAQSLNIHPIQHQSIPQPSTSDIQPQATIEDRLNRLKKLMTDGLISQESYEIRKNDILKEI